MKNGRYGVAARLRGAMVASASGVALAGGIMAAQPARAQSECGSATDNRVTCQPPGNPYSNGVNYLDPDALTVAIPAATVITGGVLVVTGTDGAVEQAGTVSSNTTGRAGVRLTSGAAGNYSGTGSVTTTGDFAPGISVTAAGPASVSARDVSTTGNGSAGIVASGSSVAVALSGRVSTTGTAATVGAAGIGGGLPIEGGTGGASNPGLDPADLTGPSVIAFFDYFFSDNAGIPAEAFDGFIQWTVSDGTVDLVGGVGPGVFGAPPNQPLGRYVDLGGSTGDPGRFETRLAYPVMPGTFNLSFDYRSTGGDLNTATASVIGALGELASYTVSSDLTTFRRFSGNFAVDRIDLARIAFQGLKSDTDNSGIGIDGVLFGPVLPIGPGGTGATNGTAQGNALGNLPAGSILTADAVVANATAGSARVDNAGLVTATGFGSRGIVATGTTGVVVAGAGRVTTAGDLATGIEAASPGAVAVTQGNVTTGGMMAPAVRATSTGAGAVAVNVGSVSTAGFASRGIDAFAQDGAVTVRVGAATTSGSNADAIVAMNNGGGAASIVATGPVTTSGASSMALRAMAATGAASVSAASVTTTGTGSAAIMANGATGATVTSTGAVSTAGANTSAIVASTVNGATSISAAGPIVKTGAGGNAVSAQSTNGAAAVTLGALTSAAGGVVAVAGTNAAIVANGRITASGAALLANGSSAAVTVATGSAVTGSDAVVLQGRTNATLTNAGTINAGGGYAVNAGDSAATVVTNTGTINGRVLFGAGADRFVNAGLFTSALDSDFGTGTDAFENSGVVRALAASRTVTFNRLESFANAGTVDLRNGSAGDTLAMPGTIYTGSGAGILALDVAFGATPAADRLTVGTAGGTTAVVLANAGPVTLAPAVVLVQASAASSAGAFTLAPGSTGSPLVGLAIAYDPATLAYSLVSAPQAGVFRTLSSAEGVRNLWHVSADAWSGHVRALRDGGAVEGTAIWGQFYGGANRRDNNRSFAGSATQAIGYRQDSFGAQAGVDFGRMNDDGGFVGGVTGGYLNSTLDFRNVADRTTYNVVNAGLYATLRSGPLFVNALGKYDWVDAKLRAPSLAFVTDSNGRAYGGQVEAGLRFGGVRLFVEPIIAVAYVASRLDDLTAIDDIGSRIGIDSRDGVRGSAGLRLGLNRTRADGSTISVYGSGEAVRQFRGRDRIAFTSGTTTLDFGNRRIGTYGRGTLGLNVAMASGVSGFLEARGEYGDDWKGGGGRGGLRINF